MQKGALTRGVRYDQRKVVHETRVNLKVSVLQENTRARTHTNKLVKVKMT